MQFFLAIIFVFIYITTSHAIDTKANYAILVDYDTQEVLFEKNADIPMAPSSMSKLMTSYVVFQRLKQGALSLEDRFTVSEKAWRMGGSKMFLPVNGYVDVKDLLLGIIVQSGNDACVTIAEGISGSEEAFVALMNDTAKQIGLNHSHFANSTGWPDPEHYMSARDLAHLSYLIIHDFPEYYHFFSVKNFVYNNIKQDNRNMLLDRNIGVDGLKTGHADAAGYGITASAISNGRRLILVVNGLKGTVERANEAEYLLQYGSLNYANVKLYKKGEVVTEATLWMGTKKKIDLIAAEDITITLPKSSVNKISTFAKYNSPIKAPVSKTDKIGELVVEVQGENIKKIFPLVAATEVKKLPLISRLVHNLNYYIFGFKH